MPCIVGAVERSPVQYNRHTRRKNAGWREARPEPKIVLAGAISTPHALNNATSTLAEWIAQQSGLFKQNAYRLEELLVHEERLTTSGVGTGEQ